ncbi:hypothetical protein B0H19DRAFT_1070521 [Mycena capillaripes]|nr:hypothetical protein B0H19DRAFT_1070521 [Mycena capillaripes]
MRGAIPCTGLDLGARDLVLTTGLIIDARLDAKKLEQTFSILVERKFPRAGARVALRNGVYEFQVPRTFDLNTPPVRFTAEDFAEPYGSAALPELPTRRVGSFTSQPFVCPVLPAEGYFRSKTCPSSLEGFLVPNTPLIHIHVAVFDDLTFIGVTSTHITFDALGTRALFHAWTRLMNGDDIDAIPGMEWDMQPLESFTGPTSVTHQKGWFNLGLFGQLLFIFWFMLRILRDPKEEDYLIRVPKAFVEDSKREIMENLKAQGSAEWVGSSDVLLAWWFKTIYSHRKIEDATPVHIHLPVDLRGKPIFPGDSTIATPYINNAIASIAIPPIPVNAFQTESLGEIALRLRRAILAYNASIPGIQADLHWRCANPLQVHYPCPPGGEYAFQTNWRVAHLEELDFSGARVEEKEKEKPRVLLAVGYILSGKNIPMRGGGGIFFEDDDAVWMTQIRGKKDWEDIRRSGRVAFI